MGAPFSKKRFCPARAPLILYEAFTSQPRVPEKPLGPKASCVKMTPGVRDISMYVWRPLSGNSCVLMGSKTRPRSAEPLSITPCWAMTTTESATPPICKCEGKFSLSATRSTMFSIFSVRKPLALTSML